MGSGVAAAKVPAVSPDETSVSRWVEIREKDHGPMFVNLSMGLSIRYDQQKECTVLEWPNGHYVKTNEDARSILVKAGLA